MRGSSDLETATATIQTAGTFERVNFTNKLASGDILVVSGTVTDNGKTYTTNPYKLTIK